ncbi:DUF695 domain-containing protein [Acinetobacter sp. C26M]|uniref:DUF695 domain-containing protein n=1 Tax=unclassified Acinetobacter TaxID=196816 RepID=UPI002036AF51|nr:MULTISPECIES: DUF695 domain-containing protein [unclassified Acinetobacter]USA47936.1 DUF695 domain-containing protein [Acinetobacter sp. C26M]USA51416.1 DUF695 domain-containing protein [Acinetobacter sp. C26G]
MGLIDKFWPSKNHTTTKESTHQLLEVPENWDFYMCDLNGQPASYFLNLALTRIAPILDRSTLLWVEIKMNHSREDGLSSSEEFDHLIEIEDQLIPALTTRLPALYVGRLTHNHLRYFYFYCKDGIDVDPILHKIMQSCPDYSYHFGQKVDSDWSTYFNDMYPNEETMQSISNRSVIEELLNHGDNLEIERPVDHWLYFQNDTDRTVFSKAILSLGFEVIQQDQVEASQNFHYQLQISRIDSVNQQSIDACTTQLIKLAQQFNAQYDGWETQIIRN